MRDSFEERINNFGLFAAVFKNLYNMRKIPDEKSISLGIYILSYIYNNMLLGEKQTNIKEIINFCSSIEKNVENDDFIKIIDNLIYEDGLSGIKFTYFNFTKNQKEEIRYKILEIKSINIKNQKEIFLSLTDTGKEFMLKTLEVYKELRITMELLFLQEQFKKGTFDNARNSVNNLRFLINEKMNEIDNLISEIKRAVWRVDFSKIKNFYDFVFSQSEYEKNIFDNIFFLLENNTNLLNLKEENKKVYNEIFTNLYLSRESHSKLIVKYEQIFKEIMNSGNMVFLNVVNKKINFETEILDMLFRKEKYDEKVVNIFSAYELNKSINYKLLFKNVYKKTEKTKIEVSDYEEYTELTDEEIQNFVNVLMNKLNVENVKLSDLNIKINKKILNFVLSLHQQKIISLKKSNLYIQSFIENNFCNFNFIKIESLDVILTEENIEYSDFKFYPLEE